MPKFVLNKLVRDKLVGVYEKSDQKSVYRRLGHSEHIAALKEKIIEEANEIPVDGQKKDVLSEIADVQQALDDLKILSGILDQDLIDVQRAKKDKKGGFSQGYFIETIELKDTDEWLGYYRANPGIFKEVDDKEVSHRKEPLSGEYEHYKGKRYEIIGVGKHTETLESLIIYRPLYDSDTAYWIRPLAMFMDTVEIDGTTIPRFKKVEDAGDEQ